ncbi:quinone oxidoreductase family protein [Dyadobacter sp. BHUBP1]|uniref:quinone oxidoreductase family protein n=1 Tax=Dyadobacter sp. BHUBP1 TaxID=3424178 RepID=UPI003D3348E8
MKANVITAHGPAREVFAMQQVADPVPTANDLILKVLTTSVNPLDCRIRNKASVTRHFPLTLGFDVCGTVVEMGPDVTGFEIGDRVIGSPTPFRNGANAEYLAIDHRSCALAGTLADATAAAIPLVGITAYEALFDRLRVRPGEWVVIHAGAGGVGHLAIQLARNAGCRIITTASRPESLAFCADELGADHVLNYKTNITDAVMDITGGQGAGLIMDNVGADCFSHSLSYVSHNGHICTILPVAVGEQQGYQLLLKNITLSYQFMGGRRRHNAPEQDNHQGQVLQKLVEMVEAGQLRPHVSKIYDWHDLAQAHEEMERGHATGKLVVQVTN